MKKLTILIAMLMASSAWAEKKGVECINYVDDRPTWYLFDFKLPRVYTYLWNGSNNVTWATPSFNDFEIKWTGPIHSWETIKLDRDDLELWYRNTRDDPSAIFIKTSICTAHSESVLESRRLNYSRQLSRKNKI
jgi:hypothetical protein|tara:strand:+ start:161 stop:562 length:402 start_codon:yes stop_codon:yes gene_type:complete